MQDEPTISVVIPTSGRPQLLPRAVASCLAGFNQGEVEVIVVPNGPDTSWQQALSVFDGNPMVKTLPIGTADANTARNHGLLQATARYVRFLDDDDVLITAGSREQYQLMDESNADVCTGAVSQVDQHGNEFEVVMPSTMTDFIASLLSRTTASMNIAHVFRRQFVRELRWQPYQPFLQDQLWIHAVARHAEPRWIKTRSLVGVWHHHQGYRISRNAIKSVHTALKTTSGILTDTVIELNSKQRMDSSRTRVAAAELWKMADECFYLSPSHWHRVARFASTLNPEVRPETFLSGTLIEKLLPPLALQWLLVPFRWLHAFAKWLIAERKNERR